MNVSSFPDCNFSILPFSFSFSVPFSSQLYSEPNILSLIFVPPCWQVICVHHKFKGATAKSSAEVRCYGPSKECKAGAWFIKPSQVKICPMSPAYISLQNKSLLLKDSKILKTFNIRFLLSAYLSNNVKQYDDLCNLPSNNCKNTT